MSHRREKEKSFQPQYYNVLYFLDLRYPLSNKIIRFVVELLHIIQYTQHNVHEREANVKKGDKQNQSLFYIYQNITMTGPLPCKIMQDCPSEQQVFLLHRCIINVDHTNIKGFAQC